MVYRITFAAFLPITLALRITGSGRGMQQFEYSDFLSRALARDRHRHRRRPYPEISEISGYGRLEATKSRPIRLPLTGDHRGALRLRPHGDLRSEPDQWVVLPPGDALLHRDDRVVGDL